MLGELKATLYDLFGYLLPGGVAILALLVGLPALAASAVWGVLPSAVAGHEVVLLLAAAYVLGHVVQALGNVLPPFADKPEERQFGRNGLPEHIIARARAALTELARTECEALSPRDAYAFADEARVLWTAEGDREIYIVREGFYRGMAAATAMLAVAAVVAALSGQRCFPQSSGSVSCASALSYAGVALAAVLACAAFTARMRRFGDYRVQRAIYRFVAARGAPSGADDSDE